MKKYSIDANTSTDTALWIKAIPAVTTGIGLILAWKRGGGLKYFSYGAVGLGAGVVVSMMAGGKNIIDIYRNAVSNKMEPENESSGMDNQAMAKYILDNFSISGKKINKDGLNRHIMGLPNYDLGVIYKMAKLSVSTKGVLPSSEPQLSQKLNEFNLTKEDYGYFTKTLLPVIYKVAIN